MIIDTGAHACSFVFTAYQSLVGGWLSSLGFITNMLIVGAAYRAYQAYKTRNPNATMKDAIAGFFNK